jgi:hypothetical protein
MAPRPTRFVCFSLAALLGCGAVALAGPPARPPAERGALFATLPTPAPEKARAEALRWLESTGKADAGARRAFDNIWAGDRPLVDKVGDTLALGDDDARTILAEARDPEASAPTEVPAAIKDTKRPAFYRANLALAYAKALSGKRVFEEALQALDSVRPEQVIDPGAYLFHKAVAEHGLGRPREAAATVARLLEDVPDAPDRYRQVAALMASDMATWKDRDLGAAARLMDNIGRRLELSRGGPQTRKMQDEVINILDDLIRDGDGPRTPRDVPPPPRDGDPDDPGRAGSRSNRPLDDSLPGGVGGVGRVDMKEFRKLAEVWGKLPPKERPKALQQMTRDIPPRYREIIERYFRELSRADAIGR